MSKEKNSSPFFIGFGIGAILFALVWYWQKSTSADEGALSLLDRLGEVDKQLRHAQKQLARARAGTPMSTPPAVPDDLQQVNGIGPTYARRLQQAGVTTIARVIEMETAVLAQHLRCSLARAQTIQQAARQTQSQRHR